MNHTTPFCSISNQSLDILFEQNWHKLENLYVDEYEGVSSRYVQFISVAASDIFKQPNRLCLFPLQKPKIMVSSAYYAAANCSC